MSLCVSHVSHHQHLKQHGWKCRSFLSGDRLLIRFELQHPLKPVGNFAFKSYFAALIRNFWQQLHSATESSSPLQAPRSAITGCKRCASKRCSSVSAAWNTVRWRIARGRWRRPLDSSYTRNVLTLLCRRPSLQLLLRTMQFAAAFVRRQLCEFAHLVETHNLKHSAVNFWAGIECHSWVCWKGEWAPNVMHSINCPSKNSCSRSI